MKAREAKSAPSADLLVCFPPRGHLALMPKPICSPARQSEPIKRRYAHRHSLKRAAATRRGGWGSQASPLLWSKNKQLDSEITEPTSPKVTCAGQIKVRPGPGNCKSWQSVMEEIEKIHNKNKKKSSWVQSLGFKKDVLQFLACLRSIRFDFRCFGAFPQSDIVMDDDDDGEEEEELFGGNNHAVSEINDESSRAVFSKWFMVLQENQNDACRREQSREKQGICELGPAVPPPNALLLMRCRSAPAKSWTEDKEEEEKEEDEDEEVDEQKEETREEKCRERRSSRNLRSLLDEEKENVKENLVVVKYGAGLCKISTDISKETWLVGGTTTDPLSRSRSWKR